MKRSLYKLLALLLGLTLLTALLPVVSASAPQELRQAVATHAKNIANTEWKVESRRYRDDRLPDERKELMRSAGALPLKKRAPGRVFLKRSSSTSKGVLCAILKFKS